MQAILIILAVTAPLFYFYGVISFLGKLSKNEAKLLKDAINSLNAVKDKISNKADKKQISNTIKLLNIELKNDRGILESDFEEEIEDVPTKSKSLSTDIKNKPRKDVDNNLDANLLLYLGAFLLIVAGGIFVSYSYQTFSDVAKTAMIAIVSLTFYVLGIWLFKKFKKLKPAGVTFTGIGLLLWPLVGVAAYNFIYQQSMAKPIWLATSVVAIGLYVFAVKQFKNSLLVYLALISILSAILSTVSLVTAPVYFLGWTLTIIASIFLLLKEKSWWSEIYDRPIQVLTQLLIPVSLLLNLNLIRTEGWFQFGMALLFASVFYALATKLVKTENKSQSLAASAILFAGAISIITKDKTGSFMNEQLAFNLLATGSIQVLIAAVLTQLKKPKWIISTLATIGSIVVLVTSIPVFDFPQTQLMYLIFGVALAFGVGIWQQATGLFGLAMLTSLILPLKIKSLLGLNFEDINYERVTLSFLGLNLFWLAFRWLSPLLERLPIKLEKVFKKNLTDIAGMGAVAAGIITIATANMASNWWLPAMLLAMAVVSIVAAFKEKQDWLILGGWILLFAASYLVQPLAHYRDYWTASLMTTIAIGIYVVSRFFPKNLILPSTTAAIIGAVVAAATKGILYPETIQPILALFIASIILKIEGYRHKKYELLDLGFILTGVALSWLGLTVLNIDEVLVYGYGWTVLLSIVSVINYKYNKNAFSFWLTTTLAALTLPLAFQALTDQPRGLFLLLQTSLVLTAGVLTKNKEAKTWGTIALVLQVLYYLKDFIAGLPAWAIFGGLGLALMFGAMGVMGKKK